MSNERDDLTPDLEELERQLDAEELELSEDEARALAQSPDIRMARAASMAIAKVESEKDRPQAMGEEITQKYLSMGRDMLSDGGANQMSGRVRGKVSNILGYDPGAVRIHTGDRAVEAADALDARAFAVGDSDIYFGRGMYNPETAEGLGVLVHELTHVADNQVGAAFSTRSGENAYSAAEDRAEAAEQFAVTQDGRDHDGKGEDQTNDAEPGEVQDKVDMQQLEDAVANLLERSNRYSMDRSGRSGTIGSS